MRLGYIERVGLPDLGLRSIAAKIDTGARTSALHVSAARPVAARGRHVDHERLVVVLMGLGLTIKQRTVEVDVEDWVTVRDTSGRHERRPVIRTTLELGRLRVEVRLGLTDRGDMRYPLLVGRTALPVGTLVDPNARHLLGRSRTLRTTAPSNPAGRLGDKI